MLRQRSRFDATMFIEIAEMRHRLLNDAPANPNSAHDSPPPGNTQGRHYMPKTAPRTFAAACHGAAPPLRLMGLTPASTPRADHLGGESVPPRDGLTLSMLRQPAIACLGVGALRGSGPLLIDRLGVVTAHTVSPVGHARRIAGLRDASPEMSLLEGRNIR